MFCTGSKGLPTPKRCAVAGISCIRPWAPTRDSAFGLNADSAWMMARTIASSTPYSRAAARTSAS
jgi:hypothetical protein